MDARKENPHRLPTPSRLTLVNSLIIAHSPRPLPGWTATSIPEEMESACSGYRGSGDSPDVGIMAATPRSCFHLSSINWGRDLCRGAKRNVFCLINDVTDSVQDSSSGSELGNSAQNVAICRCRDLNTSLITAQIRLMKCISDIVFAPPISSVMVIIDEITFPASLLI